MASQLPPPGEAVIGLIGMGEMGRMYAERLSRAGQCKRCVFPLAHFSGAAD